MGLYISSDIGTLSNMIYAMNGVSWDRLYKSYKSEYNPIWNVDGTETITETRNLESGDKGSGTTTSSGTDITKHTGTDAYSDTGDDVVKRGGEYSVTQSGTDTTRQTGTDTTGHSGTDTVKTDITSDNTATNRNFNGFNSSSAVPADNESTNRTGSQTQTNNLGTTDTETRDLSDAVTYGKSETTTDSRTETTTHGKTTTNSRDLSDAVTYGKGEKTENENAHTDTGTITTEHTRGGNIGITMTQQMLQADLDYWRQLEAKFFEGVCKSIVDMITYKIYTETDESNTNTSTVDIEQYVKDIVPTLAGGVKIADVIIVTERDG